MTGRAQRRDPARCAPPTPFWPLRCGRNVIYEPHTRAITTTTKEFFMYALPILLLEVIQEQDGDGVNTCIVASLHRFPH